jgi:aerobic carbon-monoxide dehydrogenase medium subunit
MDESRPDCSVGSYAYHRPKTLAEALTIKAATADSRFIAGGTDILVQMRKRQRPSPTALISLRNVDELAAIETGDRIRIGGAALLSDIMCHPAIVRHLPALVDSIAVLGSRQIRNVATLGGNLCNASPAADTAPPLIAYGATVEIRTEAGKRELPVETFFQGPGRSAIGPGEILSAVVLERPSPETRTTFLRRGRVKMDLAVVSVAVLLEMRGEKCYRARVAGGAVAPVPLRLKATEQILEGTALTDEILAEAQRVARGEISPITDLRSTAEYRRHLVGVYVKRGVKHVRESGANDD